MNEILSFVRSHSWPLIAFSALVLSFVVGLTGLLPIPSFRIFEEEGGYEPSYEFPSADQIELALIYVGTSECPYSNVDSLSGMIESAKLSIQQKAHELGYSFATVGIAKDWIVKNGMDHLAKFGSFDEVMTGRSWLNEGVVKYVWEDMSSVPSTPQLVVIKRLVRPPKDDLGRIWIGEDSVVTRKVGLPEIANWLRDDFSLPEIYIVRDVN